jgi:hypothetical protein
MDTQVLTTQEDAQQLARPYEDTLKNLIEHSIELRGMKPGALRTNMAIEYAREARSYLETVEASALREQTRHAYDVHRFLSRLVQKLKKPAEILKKQCDDIRVDWEHSRRANIEEDRRRREEEANQQLLEQRRAEVAHLQELGKDQEAAELAGKALTPISVAVDGNAGKPEGEVMVEVWVPKRDETERIVFSDRSKYLHWIADHPEFDFLLEDRYGKLKALLTANRGMLVPPGLEIEHTFEPRTRREADD